MLAVLRFCFTKDLRHVVCRTTECLCRLFDSCSIAWKSLQALQLSPWRALPRPLGCLACNLFRWSKGQYPEPYHWRPPKHLWDHEHQEWEKFQEHSKWLQFILESQITDTRHVSPSVCRGQRDSSNVQPQPKQFQPRALTRYFCNRTGISPSSCLCILRLLPSTSYRAVRDRSDFGQGLRDDCQSLLRSFEPGDISQHDRWLRRGRTIPYHAPCSIRQWPFQRVLLHHGRRVHYNHVYWREAWGETQGYHRV